MIRLAIVSVLLLSTAIMMRGVASDWHEKPLATSVEETGKKTAPPVETAAQPKPRGLKPNVPSDLPDLKVGYLFNQERMLASDEVLPEEEESGVPLDDTHGIAVSLDEVTYVGSIITDAFSRAIIAYPAQKSAQPVLSRSSRIRSSAGGDSEEHAQLEPGDKLGGYEVAEILPDKIIFIKEGETIEKLLHDPGKKRNAPPRVSAAPAVGMPPPPQHPGVVGAGQSRSMTIGGVTPPPAEMPGVANQPPSTPALPQSINRPAQPARPSTEARSMPMPVRRMVITREPSAQPDTSRVIRQAPGSEDAMPLPPGMNPNDPNVNPPVPGGN